MSRFIFLLICAWCAFGCANARRKYFVQAIWRHGDRAPEAPPYPADPYDETYWPRGWKELTNLGMSQMKELGTFFRKRYDGFVGRNFSSTEVFIQASDENRAVVSAQAFLNGFYPPTGASDEFEPNLAWQPLPIHTSGYSVADPLLKPTNFYCPTYDRLVDESLSKLELELTTKYANLISYVAPYVSGGRRPTLKQVRKINDLNREIAHNLTQPNWVYHRFGEYDNRTVIELATDIWLRQRLTLFGSPELARLRGGYLLGDWLRRAKKILRRVNESQPIEPKSKKTHGKQKKVKKDPTKMQLYSSHDGTMLSLLAVMGLNPKGRPVPYAASIIMEVYMEDDEKTLTVKIFMRRDGKLERLPVEECSDPCELSKFIRIYHKKAVFTEKNLYKKCDVSYCPPNFTAIHV